MKAKLDFGDYCTIEQKRYRSENEHYLHKVISAGISNTWVDVPVDGRAKEKRHDQMEDVVSCVVCGVCETEILRYRLSDVKKSRKRR
jgi:L-lactate utilization protein LutB